jgi:ribonuclease P protein component
VAEKVNEQFPRSHRIVNTSDYRAIYARGRKVQSDSFVLFGAENALEHPRLGITVSRKVGGSVVRNRVKRLFREIFRKSWTDIPHPLDLVVNARRGCANTGYSDLRREFLSAVRRMCL